MVSFWDRVSLASFGSIWLDYVASKPQGSHLPSFHWDFRCTPLLLAFPQGSELKSISLCGKHFTGQAMSPAPSSSFSSTLTYNQMEKSNSWVKGQFPQLAMPYNTGGCHMLGCYGQIHLYGVYNFYLRVTLCKWDILTERRFTKPTRKEKHHRMVIIFLSTVFTFVCLPKWHYDFFSALNLTSSRFNYHWTYEINIYLYIIRESWHLNI